MERPEPTPPSSSGALAAPLRLVGALAVLATAALGLMSVLTRARD